MRFHIIVLKLLSHVCCIGSASKSHAAATGSCISRPVGLRSFQLEAFMCAVVKLQRWWKGLLLLKLMNRSAVRIQSCTRGWIARRKATVEKPRTNVMEVWYSILSLYTLLFCHKKIYDILFCRSFVCLFISSVIWLSYYTYIFI